MPETVLLAALIVAGLCAILIGLGDSLEEAFATRVVEDLMLGVMLPIILLLIADAYPDLTGLLTLTAMAAGITALLRLTRHHQAYHS